MKHGSLTLQTARARARYLYRLLCVLEDIPLHQRIAGEADYVGETLTRLKGLDKLQLELVLRRVGRGDRQLIEHLIWQVGVSESVLKQRSQDYLNRWVHSGQFFDSAALRTTAAY